MRKIYYLSNSKTTRVLFVIIFYRSLEISVKARELSVEIFNKLFLVGLLHINCKQQNKGICQSAFLWEVNLLMTLFGSKYSKHFYHFLSTVYTRKFLSRHFGSVLIIRWQQFQNHDIDGFYNFNFWFFKIRVTF